MKQNSKIITLKIRYETNASSIAIIKAIQQQFNSCLRFTYNRLCDNKNLAAKEFTALHKNLNNVELVKSHLKNSAIYKTKEIMATGTRRSVIFGGKNNFIKRCQNKISREEFLKKDFFRYILLVKQTVMETECLKSQTRLKFCLSLIRIII